MRHAGGGGLADACNAAGFGACMKCQGVFGLVPTTKSLHSYELELIHDFRNRIITAILRAAKHLH